mgnify:CR=1 FL=1
MCSYACGQHKAVGVSVCKHRLCNRRQGSESGTGISTGCRRKDQSSSTSACGRRTGEHRIDLHTIHASNQLRGRWASAKTIDDVHASYCNKGQATRMVCHKRVAKRAVLSDTVANALDRSGCHRKDGKPTVGWMRCVVCWRGELFEPKAGRGTAGARLS